jgi:hypothetical protein
MSCWHVELGFIHRINPETCPGCEYQLSCLEHHRHSAPYDALPSAAPRRL